VTKQRGTGERQFFTWNDEHQLVGSASRRGDWVYHYDALGRRVAKRRLGGAGSGTPTWFVWDGLRMAQEETGEQCVTTVYADVGSYVPLARIDHGRWDKTVTASQIGYFHTDVNGAPEELTGHDGRVAWRGRYRTWGALAREEWDRDQEWTAGRHRPAQNLRFQGQYHDAETGLHYNTFRYYDPDIGRFLCQDPIGLAGGLNLYQYAPEPISWIDPWGWAFGSGQGTHYATSTLLDMDGNVKSTGQWQSGNMTPDEAALGFPQSTLATHTEARITRSTIAEPGDTLLIEGQYPPCNSCKGKMNAFSEKTGAKTVYKWTDENGEMRTWKNRSKNRGGCG